MKTSDRLKFTATGSSAQTINVDAAVVGCRTLAQAITQDVGKPGAIAVGDTNVPFVVIDSAGNFEAGRYTITSTTRIDQTSRESSSNNGQAVVFNGALTVYNDPLASDYARIARDRDLPFSQAVPMDQVGMTWLDTYTVTGPWSFAPGAVVKGGGAGGVVISDGTNAPTVTGFTETDGSAGYDNRPNIANGYRAEYDGYAKWLTWFQALAVASTPTEQITVATPSTQTAGTAFIVSGTYANATPAALDWSIDGGSSWNAASSPTISGGNYSFGGVTVPSANASQTVKVRDHNNTTVIGTSASFAVNASGGGSTTITAYDSQTTLNTAIDTSTLASDSGYLLAAPAQTHSGGHGYYGFAPVATAPLSGWSQSSTVAPAEITASQNSNASHLNGLVPMTALGAPYWQDNANIWIPVGTSGNWYFWIKPASGGTAQCMNAGSPLVATGAASYPSFTALTSVSTSGTGPYTYTGGSGTQFSSASAMSTTKLQAGADGSMDIKVLTSSGVTNPELIFGVTTSSTAVTYQNLPYAIFAPSPAGSAYKIITGGGVGTADASVTVADNDVLRWEWNHTAQTLAAKVNGTVLHTWTGVTAQAMSFELLFKDVFSVQPTASTGLA